MAENLTDTILFIGTAGARFMMTLQLAASGGAWLDLGGTQILVDPGPGCLVRSVKKGLDATRLSAIILTHKHLDHSNDINVMIEAMTEGGRNKRGVVFAPSDAIERDRDPVIHRYLHGWPEAMETLAEGKSYRLNGVTFHTPVRHVHGVETYGLVFETPRCTFSWVIDTKYFPELSRHYRGDCVIFNVVRLKPDLVIDHLNILEVRQLISEIRPGFAVLDHYGMTIWKARPWEIAQQLTVETGIRVIAARDFMKLDLAHPPEKE